MYANSGCQVAEWIEIAFSLDARGVFYGAVSNHQENDRVVDFVWEYVYDGSLRHYVAEVVAAHIQPGKGDACRFWLRDMSDDGNHVVREEACVAYRAERNLPRGAYHVAWLGQWVFAVDDSRRSALVLYEDDIGFWHAVDTTHDGRSYGERRRHRRFAVDVAHKLCRSAQHSFRMARKEGEYNRPRQEDEVFHYA
ncbi:MAG: hypothetical protein IKB76_00380 [Kiritimatiellae bacterium]|nr:hypothetical protein [Kiritimatiellia bacterium]